MSARWVGFRPHRGNSHTRRHHGDRHAYAVRISWIGRIDPRRRLRGNFIPTDGVLKLNGKPLAQATVMFVPVEGTKGETAVSVTDENGYFDLNSSNNRAGVSPGRYKVVVLMDDASANNALLSPDAEGPAKHAVEYRPPPKIPPEYHSAATTPFSVEIPAQADSNWKSNNKTERRFAPTGSRLSRDTFHGGAPIFCFLQSKRAT